MSLQHFTIYLNNFMSLLRLWFLNETKENKNKKKINLFSS